MDLMVDNSKKVALQDSVAKEHASWLEIREKDPKRWKGVIKDFQKKMSKFMVQRIEKSGERSYEVIVHQPDK